MKKLLSIILILGTFIAEGQSTYIDLSGDKCKIYNWQQRGRVEALTEHGQNPSLIPFGEGTWYTQRYDSVHFWIDVNNYLVGGGGTRMKYPLKITFDMKRHVDLDSLFLYFGGRYATDNDTSFIKFYTGTPYAWTYIGQMQTNLSQLAWHSINVNNAYQRFVHIVITGPPSTSLGEFVVRGTQIDTVAAPVVVKQVYDITTPVVGVNTTNGMGVTNAASPYAKFWSKEWWYVRQFEYGNFYFANDANETLNPIDYYSSTLIDSQRLAGVKLHFAFVTMTTKKLWKPTIPFTASLVEQKPIMWNLGNVNDTSSAGIPWLDNVIGGNYRRLDETPTVYAQAAYNAGRLAKGLYDNNGIKIFETSNETNGPFQSTGREDPEPAAARQSAMYDGHNSTILFNGLAVGIKNISPNTTVIMGALDVYNRNYIDCMAFWAKYNRVDGKLPFDTMNVHLYPNTSGGQGANGKGLMPESDQFHFQEKMEEFKALGDQYGVPVRMTEIGYDAYDSNGYRGPYCETAVYGNSFVNTPDVPVQTTYETHGNMAARALLVMREAEVKFDYFWLADRVVGQQTCGTFQASGLLRMYDNIAYVPYYNRTPAYYYIKTIDSMILNKKLIGKGLLIISGDSIRYQKYQSALDTTKILYSLWSPTVKNATINTYSFTMGELGLNNKVIALDSTNYTGTQVGATTYNTQNVILNISEKPIFIYSTKINNSPSRPVKGYLLTRKKII